MKSCRHSDGFTLIELMVVISTISILAAVSMPTFRKSIARARQAGMITQLRDIWTYASLRAANGNNYCLIDNNGAYLTCRVMPGITGMFHDDHGRTALDYSVRSGRYSYTCVSLDANSFIVYARADGSNDLDGDPDPDLWVVDTLGNLYAMVDDLRPDNSSTSAGYSDKDIRALKKKAYKLTAAAKAKQKKADRLSARAKKQDAKTRSLSGRIDKLISRAKHLTGKDLYRVKRKIRNLKRQAAKSAKRAAVLRKKADAAQSAADHAKDAADKAMSAYLKTKTGST